MPDPHTWHNPIFWIETVVDMSRAMAEDLALDLSDDRVAMLREAAMMTDAWISQSFADIDRNSASSSAHTMPFPTTDSVMV